MYAKLQQLSQRNEKQFHDNATQRYTAKMESLRSDQEKLAEKEEEVEQTSSECRVIQEEHREIVNSHPQYLRDEADTTREREAQFKSTCQHTADLNNQLAQVERKITATIKTSESQENGISKYITREKHNANTIRKQLQHALTQQEQLLEAEVIELQPLTSEVESYNKEIRQVKERLTRTTAAMRHFVKTLQDKIDKKARAVGKKGSKRSGGSSRSTAGKSSSSLSSSVRPKSAKKNVKSSSSKKKKKKKKKV
jgi:chromosome segregation ATPase